MNRVTKKIWKDAATLIIAAPRTDVKNPSGLDSTFYRYPGKSVNNSSRPTTTNSSQRDLPPTTSSDFEILMLQRSGQSSFMPNAHVFPGGIVDKADFSNEWLDIFKTPDFNKDIFRSLINIPGPRPPLYTEYSNSVINAEVGFRICALREAFEESGILLLRRKEQSGKRQLLDEYYLDKDECWSWRQKVHKDAMTFIQLCRHLDCVPDIWSLKEWSNWLTPVGSHRRFDTLFYICTLDRRHHIEQDHNETVQASWKTPLSYLKEHVATNIWLAPPQSYELARLTRFNSMVELADFTVSREQHGMERWMPVQYECDNGTLIVYPGDDIYPSNAENISKSEISTKLEQKQSTHFQKLNGTFEILREGCDHFNRIEVNVPFKYEILNNIRTCGHFPVDSQSWNYIKDMSSSSKL